MAVDDDLREVRARIDAAVATRARREAERDAAAATHDRALAELTSEFGVSTVEGARDLLAKLEGELAEQVQGVRDELERV